MFILTMITLYRYHTGVWHDVSCSIRGRSRNGGLRRAEWPTEQVRQYVRYQETLTSYRPDDAANPANAFTVRESVSPVDGSSRDRTNSQKRRTSLRMDEKPLSIDDKLHQPNLSVWSNHIRAASIRSHLAAPFTNRK